MLLERLHSRLIRLMYLILSPGHPRGRTDMHAVFEDDSGETLWIHTHGLTRFSLRELEMVGVPAQLRGYAHGILFDVMGYMKSVKPIAADEDFGGLLVHPEQKVPHLATIRLVNRPGEPEHSGYLRLVDHRATAESGFARRLFAAHIGCLADRAGSAQERERLARLSLETYDPSRDEWEAEAEVESNPGNWLAYEVLGHALCDQGGIDEGLEAFRELVARCPAAALRFCEIYSEAIAEGQLPPASSDPRSAFWSELDVGELEREVDRRTRTGGSSPRS